MTTLGMPVRLDKAIYAYNGELFQQIAEMVEECSLSKDTGCLHCPHILKCTRWWDTNVCEHTSGYRTNLRSFNSFALRFEQIRTGHYKGSNGNGKNRY